MNPHTKNFVAAGAIAHRRLLAFNATDGQVAQATGPTDRPAGVADFPGGALATERVDVIQLGPAEVEAGGTILPGASITSDANGRAIAAAPAAGVNAFTWGYTETGAVAGDIVRIFAQRGIMQG